MVSILIACSTNLMKRYYQATTHHPFQPHYQHNASPNPPSSIPHFINLPSKPQSVFKANDDKDTLCP